MAEMSGHTLVIAEAGVNHNGDIDMALRLIEVAADAGADYVKFQTFTATELVTATAPKAGYQVANTGNTDSQMGMLAQLELSRNDHTVLKEHCLERNIGFLSTGFDTDAVDFLVRLGIDMIKIPSGEITNMPYLRHVGELGLPVIMSTGMADLAEVQQALQILEAGGTDRQNVTVLHCTTAYPAPLEEVNLRAMLTIRDECGVRVGYSDHTPGLEVAFAAVALGACVLEKHFTLDKNLPGPDHKASLEPDELAAMVRGIRGIETALGSPRKFPTVSEQQNMHAARKSLVASRAIRKGEIFSAENVGIKRPGSGLSPMLWNQVMGQPAGRDFAKDELLDL